MRKIDKNLTKIPSSLNSSLTNQRRDELIEAKAYIKKDIYHSRYKIQDIKDELEIIYKNKCVYCEKDIGDSFYHIEHFRPKNEYCWLAYSWDNLLICCDKCNVYKNKKFEVFEQKVTFKDSDLDNIHNLSQKYNQIEKPKLINPEIDNVEHLVEFDKYGKVYSEDKRVSDTIEACQIDRDSANERRKKIIDKLKNDYESELKVSPESARGVIRLFLKDMSDLSSEYTLLKRWVKANLKTVLSL